ncbi:MAG: tRNA pseudouridine(55) synthase TruB [Candidatus Sumerlaeaceae bacterium]
MPRKQSVSSLGGVLPVIKPAGPTSHDVVQVARRVLQQRAIGHTGTLDPAAEGLLLLCIGPYTKLVPYLVESDKTYDGYIGLGIETTTDDSEGAPTLVGDAREVTLERVRQFAKRFTGEIEQVPPRYAAVKVAGKKLYEYARENIEVTIEPRPVTVFSFDILDLHDADSPADILARVDPPHADAPKTIKRAQFVTRVSSGTYVRALARDLGRDLGCGGYLAQLSRSAVGRFDLQVAMPYDVLTNSPDRVDEYLVRGAAALDSKRYPMLKLLPAYVDRLFRGQPLHEKMMDDMDAAAGLNSGAIVGIASDDGALLAVMQAERFETQMRENVYNSRFAVHFKPLRIFPNGLK